MKKYFLTFVLFIVALIAFAGNTTDNEKSETRLISGKVIDKISGEEIAGAEIKLGDKIIYTDLNGNFTTNINVNKPELIVKYISYNDTKVTVDTFSYNSLVIELASE
jgi:CarboxypepD_reg-like domain